MADKYKTTWIHLRLKHSLLIDFIVVGQRDIRDVCVTRAVRGAECWTDHRLVRAVMALHIAPAPRKPTQDCQGRLLCHQAKGPILPGTIPASARWEVPRSCDHQRQHQEMDLFQRNSQWDGEGSPWSEDQNPWRLVQWEWRKDQRSHHAKNKSYIEWLNGPVLRLQAREV